MSAKVNKSKVKKIVFVMPSIGMGEVVFISMVVGVIRENMPGASITFVSGAYSCAFLRFIKGVKECVALESLGFSADRFSSGGGVLSKLRYLWLLPRFFFFFRRGSYDLAVISGRGRLFTSWIYLVLRLSGTGELVLLGKVLQRHLSSGTHVVESYKAILREMGFIVGRDARPELNLPDDEAEEAREFLAGKGMEKGRHKIIGICPLSTRSIKNWSPAKFLELMKRLGQDPDVMFIVFAHGDEEAVARFRDGSGAGALLVGSVPIARLMALISQCDLFVSVDTGPMHIASAFGIPTVGIFGPTSAAMYGPYGEGNLVLGADVSGCRYFEPTFMAGGPVQLCYKEDRCLIDKESCVNRITVEQVVEASGKLLPGLALH